MQLHTAAGITKELRRNKVGDNDIKVSVVDFIEFRGDGGEADLFMTTYLPQKGCSHETKCIRKNAAVKSNVKVQGFE